jgi:hypothetical protein
MEHNVKRAIGRREWVEKQIKRSKLDFIFVRWGHKVGQKSECKKNQNPRVSKRSI